MPKKAKGKSNQRQPILTTRVRQRSSQERKPSAKALEAAVKSGEYIRTLGRPPKPKDELKSRNLTFRVRENLRERLQQAAQESGRSISEEIEHRVDSTFKERDIIIRAFGGLDAEVVIEPILFFLAALRLRQISWRNDPSVSHAMREAICFIADAVFSESAVRRDRQEALLDTFAKQSTAGRIVSCAVMTAQVLGLADPADPFVPQAEGQNPNGGAKS
jgi:hypothetical protein